MRLFPSFSFACAALANCVRASEIIPAPPQTKPIAFKGATIHPVSGPDIPSATIVFAEGKITAIGGKLPIPEGAELSMPPASMFIRVDQREQRPWPERNQRGPLDDRHVQEVGEINPNARSITASIRTAN